jgi:hypothetical protein
MEPNVKPLSSSDDEQTTDKLAALSIKLQRRHEAMRAGLCPACGHPMAQTQQVAGCVHALPCGCLLWRGRKKGP